jgi:uncharacterized delta-60 repeat protein
MDVMPDGRIVAAGSVRTADAGNYSVVWRFNPDGSPDPTFGAAGGRVIVDGFGFRSVAVLAGGGVVATGNGYTRFAPDGSPLGVSGQGLETIAARRGDAVTVVQKSPADFRVIPLRPDGTEASVAVPLQGLLTYLDAATLQPDGSVLIAGSTSQFWQPNRYNYIAARVRPDGTLDTNFGVGGVQYLFTAYFNDLAALLPMPDNRLVVVGASNLYTPPEPFRGMDLLAQRYVLDPPLVAAAHQDGVADEGSAMALSASDSSYANGSIVRYEWDGFVQPFDAFTPDATGPTAQVVAPDDNPLPRVAVRVTTSDGLQAVSQLIDVHVRNVAPTVESISIAPSAVVGGKTYVAVGRQTNTTLAGREPGQDQVTIVYDFGDDTGPFPPAGNGYATHAYLARGAYTVGATATDDDGGSGSGQVAVDVVHVIGKVFWSTNDGLGGAGTASPLAGITVYVDLDNDSVRDPSEPSGVSGETGDYFIDAVPDGTYAVRAVSPPGQRVVERTLPPAPYAFGPDQGAEAYFTLTDRARITGFIFNDRNASGTRDTGEGAASSDKPYLDLDNDGEPDPNEPRALGEFNIAGSYVFANLAPGTYTVRLGGSNFGNPSYNVQTRPTAGGRNAGYTVTVGAGGLVTGRDFGVVRAERWINPAVFDDRNADGARNGYLEPDLAGRVVFIDADGDGALDPDEQRARTASGNTALLAVLPGTYALRQVLPAGWEQTRPAAGAANTVTVNTPGPTTTATLFGARPVAGVVGRLLFYNDSAADGRDPLPGPSDDNAVATGIRPLLPKVTTAEYFSTYARGINGLMIDVYGNLPLTALAGIAGNLALKAGTSADPATWPDAPRPRQIDIRRGAGTAGSDRITLVWPDGAIRNTLLQVTVNPLPQGGLDVGDVFYFGNLAGDTDRGFAPRVDAADVTRTRRHLGRTDAASVATYDFNRDGVIDAADLLVARNNVGARLPEFAPPAAPAPAAAASTADAGASPRPPLRAQRRGPWDDLQHTP